MLWERDFCEPLCFARVGGSSLVPPHIGHRSEQRMQLKGVSVEARDFMLLIKWHAREELQHALVQLQQRPQRTGEICGRM